MPDGRTDLEDVARFEIGQIATNPADYRVAAAVGIFAEQTPRRDEAAMIIVGARADVAGERLAIVASGHAVMVDCGYIARNAEVRIQGQPAVAVGQRRRALGKAVRLAEHRPAARLLALLHCQPAQR